MDISVQDVTPKRAEAWLSQAGKNRTINKWVVTKYARDMELGRWMLNGESIKFNGDGLLVDGQHRLAAVTRSGRTVRMAIVRGLPDGAFETLDLGRKRSAADVLNMDGVNRATDVAAAAALVWQWRNGSVATKSPAGSATPMEVVEVARREGVALEEWVTRYGQGFRNSTGCAGTMCGLTYIFAQYDASLAESFAEGTMSGVGLRSDDPRYVLRELMLRDRVTKGRLQLREVAAFTIKAWNAWALGREMKFLRWSPAGKRPEAFPDIQGPALRTRTREDA